MRLRWPVLVSAMVGAAILHLAGPGINGATLLLLALTCVIVFMAAGRPGEAGF